MAEFTVENEEIILDGARAGFHVIPWDTDIFGVPIAHLAEVSVENPDAGKILISRFQAWCAEKDIHLCSAKCPQERTIETLFLQEHGFRFVEIAYTPVLEKLQDIEISDTALHIRPARPEDEDALVAIAGTVFDKGRFHDDPRIGPELSNVRYAGWMRNSFKSSCQRVEKILDGDLLIGVFVTEMLDDGTVYWWLTAITPETIGTGIAKKVWSAMMAHAQREGATAIRTGISSHNLRAHNLYIALDFRISAPCVMLHWLRKPIPGALP